MTDKKEKRLSLGELAEKAKLPPRTLRFYIARGLLPGPRKAGRAAEYGAEHLKRLQQIKGMQAKGLSLAEIGRLLGEEASEIIVEQPRAWWSYPIQEDVMVWVRADVGPWRLKQVRNALKQMVAHLSEAGKKEKDGNGSK